MPAAVTSLLRRHWPVVVLAIVAAAVALWAHHHLFPALSWNRDEPVYLWHADLLRHGQLTATDGGHLELFGNWLSAERDGVRFTQYTLGWPLVLVAADLLTGSTVPALPASAALAVFGIYALAFELSRRRRVASLAAALLVASPILAIQSGVYLGYIFTLGMGTLAGALLLSGLRLRRPARLVSAGCLLGWVFLTRPYDGLLWGAAFAAAALVTAGRDRWSAARGIALTASAALPFVAAALLYNRHVTGHPLEFPITAADPLDTFGFGVRRLMPTFAPVEYDLASAVRSTAKNFFLLPWFLVGGYLGIAVAAVGAWRIRRDPALPVLLAVAAVFPVGYFVFWGTFLSSQAARISGPIYFVPLYGVVCILAALALDRWWTDRRAVAFGVLAVLAIATLPGAVTRFAVNREISLQQEPWRASTAGLEGPALVFVADTVPYLLFTNPFSSNPPGLDGDILFASAGPPAMLDLIAERPDRIPYLQQASLPNQELGPREDPRELDVTLTPIEVVRAPALDLVIDVEPPAGARYVHLEVTTGGGTFRRTEALSGTGPHGLTVTVAGPVGEELSVAPAERGTIQVMAGFGATPEEAQGAPLVRRSLPYRSDGDHLETITPALAARFFSIGELQEWRHAGSVPELSVEVRAAGA